MTLERVISGINKYINAEIYSTMNDWQEVLARIAVGRIAGNTSDLKRVLMENTFVKTFAIIDGNGNVDIASLLDDFRRQIQMKGKLDINVPMFGKFSFTLSDIDKLQNFISEG